MDDFKKNQRPDFGDYDDIEVIDATGGDVIEVVDPYESEVIEINIQRDNIIKRGNKPSAAPPPPSKMPNRPTPPEPPKAPQPQPKPQPQPRPQPQPGPRPQPQPTPQSQAKPVQVDREEILHSRPQAKPEDNALEVRKPKVNNQNPDGAKKDGPGPKGKIVVPESIDVGGSTTTILKKAPRDENNDKKAASAGSNAYGTRTASSASSASSAAPSDEPQSSFKDKKVYFDKDNMVVGVLGKEIPVKLLGIVLGGLLAIIILVSILSSGGKTTINMNSYTKVTFEGFDGTAVPVVTINYEKISADYGNKIKVDGTKTLEDIIKECVDYKLSKTEGIASKEVIYLDWVLNLDKFEKATNGSLKGVQKRCQAEALEPLADNYDIFANVGCKFEGYSGEGTVTVTGTDEKLTDLIFTASKTTDLVNGDTLTVTASVEGYDDVAAYAKTKGVIPASVEKEYSVSGLTEYEKLDIFAGAKLSFSGYNGLGEASVSGDTGVEGVSYLVDSTGTYSNGDKVTVKVVSNGDKTVEEIVRDLHYSIDSDVKLYPVEGLTIPEEYNVFDEIKIYFSGISPNGALNIDISGISVPGLVIIPDKDKILSNGDIVTLSVNCEDGSDVVHYCLTKGLKLSSVTNEVEISGLSFYLDSVEQLSDENLLILDEASRGIMNSVISGQIDESTIAAINFQNCFIQYPNSSDVTLAYNPSFGGDIHNRLYMVYKIDVSNNGDSFSYYWPILYANIIIDKKGDMSVNTSEYIAGLNEIQVNGVSYLGYETLEDFVTKHLLNDSAVYSYESK